MRNKDNKVTLYELRFKGGDGFRHYKYFPTKKEMTEWKKHFLSAYNPICEEIHKQTLTFSDGKTLVHFVY